jgi:beta-barrel assembly-enhancing protease
MIAMITEGDRLRERCNRRIVRWSLSAWTRVRWADRLAPRGQCLRQAVMLAVALTVVLPPLAWADRTQLKPGWNMFSPQQDVEVGQQVSVDAEKQVPMMNDSRVDSYLNNLGRRLAAHAPGYKFPYTYKTVNDRAINAFALPGGHVYINRGVIETAENEAQLAGVMAHETSHVALRHGTNQASKASAAQVPLAILGGLLGSNSTGAALAQLGAGFTLNSIMLKYSRSDETQADVMGTQILYDSAYDPRAMAQFFEKLMAQSKGKNPVEFFSDHPNPDNRLERVDQEIDNLGGSPRGAKTDSQEFRDIKRYVLSRPAPPGKGSAQSLQGDTGSRTSIPAESPSTRVKSFENSVLRIDYPDNWQTYGQGDAVTIAPRGGLVDDGKGNKALAYGVLVNIYEPHVDNPNQQRLQPEGYGQTSGMSLETATDRLVEELRYSNQKMRIIRNHERIQVDGQPALSTYFSNDSPLGGRETDRLVTLQHPEGLLFLVFAAPERNFQGYESAFQQMLYSVRVQSGNNPTYSSSGNDRSYSGPGRMTWRGRVDAYVELTVQNNRVRSIEKEGAPTVNEQVNFSSPLPRADVRVSVNKLNGRGEVSVIQQPNQSNNYTAIIKILDDKGGADDYEIEVDWR